MSPSYACETWAWVSFEPSGNSRVVSSFQFEMQNVQWCRGAVDDAGHAVDRAAALHQLANLDFDTLDAVRLERRLRHRVARREHDHARRERNHVDRHAHLRLLAARQIEEAESVRPHRLVDPSRELRREG